MNGRGVKRRRFNSRWQRGVRGNRLRIISCVVKQRREGWDHGVRGEVVTLRLHRSEDVHALQTEQTRSHQNRKKCLSHAILHYTPQLEKGVRRQHNYSTEAYNFKSHTYVYTRTSTAYIQRHYTHDDSIIIWPVAFIQKVKLAF